MAKQKHQTDLSLFSVMKCHMEIFQAAFTTVLEEIGPQAPADIRLMLERVRLETAGKLDALAGQMAATLNRRAQTRAAQQGE